MSDRSSRVVLSHVRLAIAIAAATALLLAIEPVTASWARFHGDAENTGFI
jgi:hypothetical protein